MAASLPLLAMCALATALLAYGSTAALRLWTDWLALKRLELGEGARRTPARLELADLRQRIRRLESIADGDG
jgi:hypothetical protein